MSIAQRSAISSVVGTASGQAANCVDHLGRVLQVELVGVEGQLRLGERALGLDAEQRRVVLVVLAAEVVDVAGRDQRPADLAGDLDDSLVGLVLLGDPVLLDLEVDVVGAEDLHQLVGVGARLGRVVGDQPLAEARLRGSR